MGVNGGCLWTTGAWWQGLSGKQCQECRWGGSGQLSLEVPMEVGEVPLFWPLPPAQGHGYQVLLETPG